MNSKKRKNVKVKKQAKTGEMCKHQMFRDFYVRCI